MKKGMVIAIIVLLSVSAITGVWFFRQRTTGNAVQDSNVDYGSGATKEFKVDAFRFGYTPDTITVKKGDQVKMIINNIDTMHGINIPELGASGNANLEFTADKQGEFTWYCNTFCGGGHGSMSGKLIVE